MISTRFKSENVFLNIGFSSKFSTTIGQILLIEAWIIFAVEY